MVFFLLYFKSSTFIFLFFRDLLFILLFSLFFSGIGFQEVLEVEQEEVELKNTFWHYRPTNYYRALTTWKDYAWVHLYKVDLVNDDDNNTKETSFSYFFLTKCFYFHGVVFLNKTLVIYWQEGTKWIEQDAFSFANLFWISHNYVTFKSIRSIEIA